MSKPGEYREIASDIVSRYLTETYDDMTEEQAKGYEMAIKMALEILRGKEIAEVNRFYDFKKAFPEDE